MSNENSTSESQQEPQATGLTEEMVVSLMRCLEHTHEHAYSCAEAFDLLDEYVELVVSDDEAAMLMPLVKNHMEMCPDCRTHYDVLIRILKSESQDNSED